MHVCLVCQEYPPDVVGGGIGTYTANLARGLAAAGHRVSVVARALSGSAPVTADGPITVHRIRPSRIGPFDGKTFADAYLYAHAVTAEVKRLAERERIDILQSPEHGAEGLTLSQVGIPHVVRFHTPLFLVNRAVGRRLSAGGRIVHLMERTSARRAALNTSASRALADRAAAAFGIPSERIRIVPNSIDHETFRPAREQTDQPPTVLYVGKVALLKGALVLAEAIPLILRQIPTARVLIVGSDHRMPDGRSTREALGGRLEAAGVRSGVTFVDPVERSQLLALYQRATVYVFPTFWDNFPNTCLEAMACGLPVVASAVGGLPEIIDDGVSGFLVPPHHPQALADAAVRVLADAALRRRIGEAARQRVVAAFTSDRIVRATLATYREAIERAGRTSVLQGVSA